MRSRALAALLAISLTGCAGTAQQIYGVWTVPDTGGGPYYFAHYAYMKDGRKCSVLFEFLPTGVEVTAFLNRWELNNGVMTITYGPNNSIIAEGHVSKSKVNELTASRFVYTIFEPVYPDMKPEVSIRLPDVRPARVCALAHLVLM